MLKVLIAEDELFVRLGIKNSVSWSEYDMQVVGNVQNGKIAWEKIEQYNPDIILTDIRMPEMDGIQLIEKISEMHKDIYIIVITCLEDFDLVKKLLSYGIKDYLLKSTMTEEEINLALKKAYDHFQNYALKKTDNFMEYVDPKIQCNVAVRDFLEDKLSLKTVGDILNKNGIKLHNKKLVLAFGNIDITFDSEQNDMNVPIVKVHETMFDLIHNKTYSELNVYIFPLEDRRFVIILAYPQDYMEAEVKKLSLKILESIHSDIEDYMNILVSFSVGYGGENLQSLKNSFFKCVQTMDEQYIVGDGCIVCEWEDLIGAKITQQCDVLIKSARWIEKIIGASIYNEYKKLIYDLNESAVNSKNEMTYMLMEIANFISTIDLKKGSDEKKKCDKALIKSGNLTLSVAAIVSFLQSCEQQYLLDTVQSNRKEIVIAVDFINQNLSMSELSLGLVAKHVGLSETYFSAVFKQEMKQAFVQYLTLRRIEKAKKLLKETNAKMVDISLQSGFSDVAYFSKVFKKNVKISPSEWRGL